MIKKQLNYKKRSILIKRCFNPNTKNKNPINSNNYQYPNLNNRMKILKIPFSYNNLIFINKINKMMK